MSAHSSGGIQFDLSPVGMRELLAGAKEFDKTLATNLRREIRNAAKIAADKVRAATLGGSYKTDVGLRQSMAAGINVAISTSQSKPGVAIRNSAAYMDPKRASILRHWQSEKGWRHPVFGNADAPWVSQRGNRPFYPTLAAERQAFTESIERAMRGAADDLAALINAANGG